MKDRTNNKDTVLFTVRISRETKEQLEALAENMGRSTNYIADEALSSYISENAWQVEAIRKGGEQADAAGPFVAMEDVKRWVESWGTDHESSRRPRRPSPVSHAH